MTISNELSSDIATALLAAKDKSPRELEDLKEILLTVHTTLQQLEADSNAARRVLNTGRALSERVLNFN